MKFKKGDVFEFGLPTANGMLKLRGVVIRYRPQGCLTWCEYYHLQNKGFAIDKRTKKGVMRVHSVMYKQAKKVGHMEDWEVTLELCR